MANVDAYYISIVEKDLLNIYSKNLPINDRLGKIGEKFVKYGIKYYFFSKGFKVRKTGERTFKISGQYKAKKGGVGGIDFRLQFIYRGKRYDCYVEVKNWKKLQFIPNTMFNSEILNRFTKNANISGCIWIVTMNKRNVALINQRCSQNNINILSLEEHITYRFLNTIDLTYIMDHFLNELSTLFYNLTKRRISPVKRTSKINKPGTLDWDLEIGLPYDLLHVKYHKSVGALRKRYNQLKRKVKDLPDKRSAEWRGMQMMTVKDMDKYYIQHIKRYQERIKRD